MKNRWLVALGLIAACALALGASTAQAGSPAETRASAQQLDADTDAAVASWMRQLDRTNHVVPSGRGYTPRISSVAQEYVDVIDDFEQAERDLDFFKGWVLVQDLNGPIFGEYFWGASDCRAKGGSRSAWAINNGSDGTTLQCGDHYPNGLNSSALLRLDLSGWDPAVDSLELVYDFWLNLRTEIEGGVVPDGLFVFYHLPTSIGELPFERVILARLTGQLPDRFWDTPWRIPLNAATDLNDPERVFNLAGLKDVDIEFVVVTKQRDGTTFPEGVFIDNVRIEASDPPGMVTPTTPRPTTVTPTTPPTTVTPTTVTPTTVTPTTVTPTTVTPTMVTPTTVTPTTPVTPTMVTPTTVTPTTPTTPTTVTPTTVTPTTVTPTPEDGNRIFLPLGLKRAPIQGGEATVEPPTEEPVETPGTTVEPSETPSETVEPTVAPGPLTVGFAMLEVDGSGVYGTGAMTETLDGIDVQIVLTGTVPGAVHPAHIHAGSCAELGSVVLPLEGVADGVSTTLLAGELLSDYANGDHAVAVQLSVEDPSVVTCGDIPIPE